MSRPIRAWIHLDALSHNLAIARCHAKKSKVYAVVKANAYGHGIEQVYPALQQADGFALLDLAEGKRLRTLGWQGDILLLEGIFSVQDYRIVTTLILVLPYTTPYKLNGYSNFSLAIPQRDFIFLSK